MCSCPLLDTPNDDSSKVPEAEFKKGDSEKVVDHLAALIDLALDRVGTYSRWALIRGTVGLLNT